jgi:hypothetical protein
MKPVEHPYININSTLNKTDLSNESNTIEPLLNEPKIMDTYGNGPTIIMISNVKIHMNPVIKP